MLKNLSIAALPLFALSVSAGCTSSASDDELAGEADTEPSADGKADSPNGASTYFELRSDQRRCASPMCGGFFLDRLNSTTTTCHDGTHHEACYTPELDWSQSALAAWQQEKLLDKAGFAFGHGVQAIVRGHFAKKNLMTPVPTLGRFVVTEAWIAQSDDVAEGIFAKVFENGVRCIAAPCPSLGEKGLNSSRATNISDLDFSAGTFTAEAIDALVGDYVAPGGVIVAGDRYTYSMSGRAGKGRTVTQAYRNVANLEAPAPAFPVVDDGCVVSGCSGEICADQSMFSTCIARATDVCYHQDGATCKKQITNHCGWTATPALSACLAHPPTN